jgi:hypothetical protein
MTMSSETKTPTEGRPVEHTAEIDMAICERLAEGESLRTICADPSMPEKATVLDWLAHHDDFRESYELITAEFFKDECFEIAYDSRGDWVEKVRNGRVVMVRNPGQLARCRLRLDVRCWVMDQRALQNAAKVSRGRRRRQRK